MAQRSIRFGISDTKGLCSATWKIWTETSGGNSEIYLACRSLGGELKASMHQSGKWHIAFNKSTYEEKVKGAVPTLNDRFTDKWPRPPVIAEGVTLAFRIITPSKCVTSDMSSGKYKGVKWIDKPNDDKAIEVYILITSHTVHVSNWPGKTSMGTQLVDSFELNNGDTVWVVYSVINTPDFSGLPKGTGYLFKGKSKSDLVASENLRALLFGEESDGSRTIYDLALGPKSS